jgi:hypothetical protein
MVNTVPKKRKPFASMEAAVRFWFAHAGAGTPARERTVDFKLAELIDAERQRALFVKKNKCVGHPAERKVLMEICARTTSCRTVWLKLLLRLGVSISL